MSKPVFDFPADETDFQAAWSSCAGELNGLCSARKPIETAAVNAFLMKDDKLANTLRNLCNQLDEKIKEASTQLDGYIKESARRSK